MANTGKLCTLTTAGDLYYTSNNVRRRVTVLFHSIRQSRVTPTFFYCGNISFLDLSGFFLAAESRAVSN
jgi:hypothetical protein